MVRSEKESMYIHQPGKAVRMKSLEVLKAFSCRRPPPMETNAYTADIYRPSIYHGGRKWAWKKQMPT